MDILGTLGISDVPANPDDVPVGNYDAVVHESSYVLSKNKDTIAHVIRFKVVGGDRDGAKPLQWNTLGEAPRDAEGNFPAKVEDVVTYKPTMSEQQKSYYKKTWVDCGVPEDQVGLIPPETLVGKPVTIRAYLNNGYKNIAVNGVRFVDGDAAPDGTVTPEGNAEAPMPFSTF